MKRTTEELLRQVLIEKIDASRKLVTLRDSDVTSHVALVTSREGSSRGTLQRYLNSCDDVM